MVLQGEILIFWNIWEFIFDTPSLYVYMPAQSNTLVAKEERERGKQWKGEEKWNFRRISVTDTKKSGLA